MQALTIAIGQTGINFFCQQYVSQRLQDLIRSMPVPDSLIDVGSFTGSGAGMGTDYIDVKVQLTAGTLQNFNPVYQRVTQVASGNPMGSQFTLDFEASHFSARYRWTETGSTLECVSGFDGENLCKRRNFNNPYDYSPDFAGLLVKVTTAFQFNPHSNTYDIVEINSTTIPGAVTSNIPSASVVRNDIQGCGTAEVSKSAEQAISSLNLFGAINQIMPALLHSIPASGNLGHDIVFEFGLGDSGLQFSTDAGRNGIQIGVTGQVRYKGEVYGGSVPPLLGLPPILASSDPNYLQTYVSSYSVNGLQWACFKAGLLHTTATPSSISNPDALYCSTYAPFIQALVAYDDMVMYAAIMSLTPPTTEFQSVWEMNQSAQDKIASIPGISSNLAKMLSLNGRSYLTQAELESALSRKGVDEPFLGRIADCAKQSGMVMRQNLQFTVTIQDNEKDQPWPYIQFSVDRIDLLTHLRLGLASDSAAQTLKFDCRKYSSKTTFITTTVPGLDAELAKSLGITLWTTVDSKYDDCLKTMGEKGVPIPIMQGFKFVFESAELSIQDAFVSIKAKVRL